MRLGDGTTHYGVMAQADPNGLFMPDAAEGTWILLKDPNGTEVKPVYVEPRIVVSPFKLDSLSKGHFELPASSSATNPEKFDTGAK